MIHEIPEVNFERFEKKIKTIKNKCHKYGCEFKYERLGDVFHEHFDRDLHKNVQVKYIQVDVEGVAKINDWEFVASLEYTDAGNMIRGIGNYEVPERYYSCDAICEHCNTTHLRKKTFIVRNSVTGEFKQVGSSCLKDFTNGLSAEAAACVSSFIEEIEEYESFGSGSYGSRFEETKLVAAYCAEAVRCFGFKSRDGGRGDSTADLAHDIYVLIEYNGRWLCEKRKEELKELVKNVGFNIENSKEMVNRVFEWVLTKEENTNYWHNAKVICASEWAEFGETSGIIASVFQVYNREVERMTAIEEAKKKNAEEAATSEWVGEVGKRIKVNVVSARCLTSWETQYGMTYVFKFVDDAGNVFTWKTGNYVDEDFVGTVVGTVKEHKEYREVKQTELTRCKLEKAKSAA